MRGGTRVAARTIAGNETGVFAWALPVAAASGAQCALRGTLGTWIERVSATVLMGLGARLALAQR